MNRLVDLVVIAVIGTAVLCAAVPCLIRLFHAVVPIAAVLLVLGCIARVVWFYTRSW